MKFEIFDKRVEDQLRYLQKDKAIYEEQLKGEDFDSPRFLACLDFAQHADAREKAFKRLYCRSFVGIITDAIKAFEELHFVKVSAIHIPLNLSAKIGERFGEELREHSPHFALIAASFCQGDWFSISFCNAILSVGDYEDCEIL